MSQHQDGWSESTGDLTPTWDFEKYGPTVSGEYVGYKTEVGVNKSDIVTIRVQTQNGPADFGVWCNARLKTLMANPDIRLGMELNITRLGRIQTKTAGRSYWDFKVLFRPMPQQVNFQQPVQQPAPQPQYVPPVQQPPVQQPVQQPQYQPPVQQPNYIPPAPQPNYQPPVQQPPVQQPVAPPPPSGAPAIGDPNRPPF